MAFTPNDFNKDLYTPLAQADPAIQNIIDKETWRQFSGLELIASENLTSRATMEANGSILTNKYSEGLPGARYYGGNEWIDELEQLCRERALKAFNLDPAKWGVNVQPYSGSTANFAALTALIQPQDRLMGLGLPDGGHLTHGYYTAKKKISASSIYFQSLPYGLDPATELIDYAALTKQARLFKPRLVVCGASAYPRDWDYAALRATADEHGAWLMADIAHTSGLVAAGTLADPFAHCDVVTTTTHNNTIAAIAVALGQAAQPSFKAYAQQVVKNAQAMSAALIKNGYKLQTGGTDNHLILWDLRPLKLTGSKVEKICDFAGITINKNAVSGDQNAQAPGGIRLGTSALTSRSMTEADMDTVAGFLHRAVQLSLDLQKAAGSKLLKDFVRVAGESADVKALAKEVRTFARRFPLPGVDTENLKRPAGIHEDD